MVTVEKVAQPVELGEGPHWDLQSEKLYYVDIIGKKILRFDPETGKVTSVYLKNGPVGVAIPLEGATDKFVAGCGSDIVHVTWDGESDCTDPSIKKIVSLDTDRTGTRINDGKCDSSGRLWVGTMALEKNGHIEPNCGSFYVIDKNSHLRTVIPQVSISNGITWNIQNDLMYYIDSPVRQIWSFDYNPETGSISNKKVVFDLADKNIDGIPDGMTVDANNNLWVALFNGSAVIQIDPRRGQLLQKINLPVPKITSVAFGGPNLDILYVTSSRSGISFEEKENTPDAGSLYAIKHLGIQGCLPNNFKYC